MTLRKLTGALLIGIMIALGFVGTVVITGSVKSALLIWAAAIVSSAAIAVGFFLLFV